MRRQRVPTNPDPAPPRRRRSRRALALLAAGTLVVAAACGDDEDSNDAESGDDGNGGGQAEERSGPAIEIGAQNFGESQILAEIYEQALDGEGFEAETVEVGGYRDLLFDAFEAGDVNFAVDYVASELEFLNDFAGQATNDLDETLTLLEAQLEGRDMVAFEPAEDAVNTNAFTVTEETAEDLNLETLSDLAAAVEDGEELTLGGPEDCAENPYCLPGLEEVYGVDLSGGFTPLADSGLVSTALEEGEIDVGVLFSTDGVLSEGNLVVLEDDQGMLAADNVIPVATQELADAYDADLADVVNAISAELTTDELIELNAQFDLENEDAEDIASAWLEDHPVNVS